mmetsp:Transcript_54937/g.164540  ORF Transcript_54937/g.164540 Transcript_54937/m.164540 type:complete len:568 (+) Transcript_54937:1370-3073(+)
MLLEIFHLDVGIELVGVGCILVDLAETLGRSEDRSDATEGEYSDAAVGLGLDGILGDDGGVVGGTGNVLVAEVSARGEGVYLAHPVGHDDGTLADDEEGECAARDGIALGEEGVSLGIIDLVDEFGHGGDFVLADSREVEHGHSFQLLLVGRLEDQILQITQYPHEIFLAETQQRTLVARCRNVRHTFLLGDERPFAEISAATQMLIVVLGLSHLDIVHPNLTVLDDVKHLPLVPLANNLIPLVDLHLRQRLGDLIQILLVEIGEEGDLLQNVANGRIVLHGRAGQNLAEGILIDPPDFAPLGGHAGRGAGTVVQQGQFAEGSSGADAADFVPVHLKVDHAGLENVEIITHFALSNDGLSPGDGRLFERIDQRLGFVLPEIREHEIPLERGRDEFGVGVRFGMDRSLEIGVDLNGRREDVPQARRLGLRGELLRAARIFGQMEAGILLPLIPLGNGGAGAGGGGSALRASLGVQADQPLPDGRGGRHAGLHLGSGGRGGGGGGLRCGGGLLVGGGDSSGCASCSFLRMFRAGGAHLSGRAVVRGVLREAVAHFLTGGVLITCVQPPF